MALNISSLAPGVLLLNAREAPRDYEILVIYRPDQVIGVEPEESYEVVVQGQLIRLTLTEIEEYLGPQLEPAVFIPFAGEPIILTSPIAH